MWSAYPHITIFLLVLISNRVVGLLLSVSLYFAQKILVINESHNERNLSVQSQFFEFIKQTIRNEIDWKL